LIISRRLIKELAWYLLVATTVLVLVVISTRLIRYFANVAEGELPVEAVWPLAGYKLLWALVTIIPLAYFFSIVTTLGRWYRDSEADALAAAGVGLPQLARPVLVMGVAVAVVTGLMSFWVAPWASTQGAVLEHRVTEEADSLAMMVGNFRRAGDGRFVIYAESLDPATGELRNVFIRALGEQQPTILVAKRAFRRVEPSNGHQYMVLEEGHRYDGSAGESNFRSMDYRSYEVLMREREMVPIRFRTKALPTGLLLAGDSAEFSAELHWRLAAPLGVLVLSIMALPLSQSGPRAGRGGKVLTAIFVYLVYSQLLGVGQSWIAQGQMPVWLGLWWIHLLLVGLAALLWDIRANLGVPFWRRKRVGWRR